MFRGVAPLEHDPESIEHSRSCPDQRRYAATGELTSGSRSNRSMDIAKLALEDGTVYTGKAFGARGESRRRGRLQHEHDGISGDPH